MAIKLRKGILTIGRAAVAGFIVSNLAGLPLAAQPPAPPPAPVRELPPRPSVAALRIDEPIQVDGSLEEPAWQEAQVAADFVQFEPSNGQPATERTEVRVAFTNEVLYIAVHAFASAPAKVVAEEMQRDSQLFRDDSVIILLDTFHDRRNAYWFETNANGARTDALLTDEGRDFNVQWDGVWKSVGRRTADGWTAELAIPFSTLRFDPNNDTWGFNVRRLIRHKNEEVFWASIPLDANLFRVSLAGTLTGIRGPEPGLNLRLKPFAVGESTDVADDDESAENDGDIGLDVKWGLTRMLTLDLTYHTDFAEVEVDDQVTNLTRFSVFFPEKREFFLEGAGIFEFGFNPPGVPFLKPFFSRRIGIGPFGEPTEIDWGARLTGRAGPWSIGLLEAQTGEVDQTFPFPFTVPENNWGVVRLKRNVGVRSTVGMMFTNRDASGSFGPLFNDYNRTYGFDADFNPSRALNLAGFFTKSDDALSTGSDDWSGGGRIAWRNPLYNWTLDVMQIGADYNPEAGFLLRRDIRRYTPRFNYLPRPKISGVRNLIFGMTGDLITDTDDRQETLEIAANLFGVRFATEDEIVLFGDYSEDRVPAPFAIAPGVVIPAGEYTFSDTGLAFETNNSRRLSTDGYVLKGEYYGGDRISSRVNMGWRPSRHLRTDTTWLHDDLDLPGGRFENDIIRQRVGVSITPDLATNTYLQYNEAANLLSLNLRFNWIYRPGSDIFIVFNQNWHAADLGDLSSRDRAVIVKLTYLLEL